MTNGTTAPKRFFNKMLIAKDKSAQIKIGMQYPNKTILLALQPIHLYILIDYNVMPMYAVTSSLVARRIR